MNLSFLDAFRPYLSRVIGGAVGAAAGVVFNKFGFNVDPSTQTAITGGIVAAAYGVVHKFIDKKVNPADTASTHLAVQGQSDVAALKK